MVTLPVTFTSVFPSRWMAAETACLQPLRGSGVRHKDAHDDPFYPTHYFRRQVVVWLVQNHQRVWYNKHMALEANYSLDEETPTFRGPLTYKSYCRHLLDGNFWGDQWCSMQ